MSLIISHHITSHHISSHHITCPISCHIPTLQHHTLTHPLTPVNNRYVPHHISSHHIICPSSCHMSLIIPHHITSHHITSHHITCPSSRNIPTLQYHTLTHPLTPVNNRYVPHHIISQRTTTTLLFLAITASLFSTFSHPLNSSDPLLPLSFHPFEHTTLHLLEHTLAPPFIHQY